MLLVLFKIVHLLSYVELKGLCYPPTVWNVINQILSMLILLLSWLVWCWKTITFQPTHILIHPKKKFTFQLSKCMKCLLVLSVRRIYDSASMQNSVDSTEWWWMRLLKQALLGVVRGLSFRVYDVRVSQKVQHWNQLIFILDSGSLILEMGALSRLTGDPTYEYVAIRALRKLWSMRSSLNLLGTTLDVVTGDWIEYSAGIGAGRYSLVFQFILC